MSRKRVRLAEESSSAFSPLDTPKGTLRYPEMRPAIPRALRSVSAASLRTSKHSYVVLRGIGGLPQSLDA